jgi:mono/diheme cytochrome c family protein
MRAFTIAMTLWALGCSDPLPGTVDRAALPADPLLAQINDDYVATVKPLFQRSCASCHGAGRALPWYHAVPLARGLIDDDVAKARRTMDMASDFPFAGRGSPAEYLDAIHDVVRDGSMPPFRYRALHWGARLDGDEQRRVLAWVERSLRRLRAPPADGARRRAEGPVCSSATSVRSSNLRRRRRQCVTMRGCSAATNSSHESSMTSVCVPPFTVTVGCWVRQASATTGKP